MPCEQRLEVAPLNFNVDAEKRGQHEESSNGNCEDLRNGIRLAELLPVFKHLARVESEEDGRRKDQEARPHDYDRRDREREERHEEKEEIEYERARCGLKEIEEEPSAVRARLWQKHERRVCGKRPWPGIREVGGKRDRKVECEAAERQHHRAHHYGSSPSGMLAHELRQLEEPAEKPDEEEERERYHADGEGMAQHRLEHGACSAQRPLYGGGKLHGHEKAERSQEKKPSGHSDVNCLRLGKLLKRNRRHAGEYHRHKAREHGEERSPGDDPIVDLGRHAERHRVEEIEERGGGHRKGEHLPEARAPLERNRRSNRPEERNRACGAQRGHALRMKGRVQRLLRYPEDVCDAEQVQQREHHVRQEHRCRMREKLSAVFVDHFRASVEMHLLCLSTR